MNTDGEWEGDNRGSDFLFSLIILFKVNIFLGLDGGKAEFLPRIARMNTDSGEGEKLPILLRSEASQDRSADF
jgi:hypothetical protein